MAVYPCIRFRKPEPTGSETDWVVSLIDQQVWWGVPELHPMGKGWCYPHHGEQDETRADIQDRQKIWNKALENGYHYKDHVLIDDESMVVEEGIGIVLDALIAARKMNDTPQAEKGPKMPEKAMPPDPYYWELQVFKLPPKLLVQDIVYAQAARVSAVMPEYTAADAEALWTMLNSGNYVSAGVDTGGEIPKDGSVRTLGHLLVLRKTAIELDAHWSEYAHLTIINGDWVLKGNGSLDAIAMLRTAGLDPDDKKAPATQAAIALGLLPAPIDLSAAPGDNFYL